jgi:hypothetical protein
MMDVDEEVSQFGKEQTRGAERIELKRMWVRDRASIDLVGGIN